jgi:hypothetical protein
MKLFGEFGWPIFVKKFVIAQAATRTSKKITL